MALWKAAGAIRLTEGVRRLRRRNLSGPATEGASISRQPARDASRVGPTTDERHTCPDAALQRTPLYELHVALGAKMVPFAGYEMPVQYPLGILKEHLHTREKAGLFDVSHMGQAFLIGPDHATTAAALEALVPADIVNLEPGQQRYTQLLNDDGGIIDDLMVTRSGDIQDDGSLMLVVNASRKEVDFAHIAARLPAGVRLQPAPERALLALQGPAAKHVMAKLSRCCDWPAIHGCRQRSGRRLSTATSRARATRARMASRSRSPPATLEKLARLLLAQDGVQPIGLGARDSCGWRQAFASMATTSTRPPARSKPASPGPSRSGGERKAAFPAPCASRRNWPTALRAAASASSPMAARRLARAPRSSHCWAIGSAWSPRAALDRASMDPIAMGYVAAGHAEPGTPVNLMVRGKALSAGRRRITVRSASLCPQDLDPVRIIDGQ